MHTETLGFLDVKLFYVLNSDPELLLFIYCECLDLCLYHLIFPILFNVDHSALIKMHLKFTKKKKHLQDTLCFSRPSKACGT